MGDIVRLSPEGQTMIRRVATVGLLLVVAAVSGGCGTFLNQQGPGMYPALQGRQPCQPFGGVGVDLDAGRRAVERYAVGVEPGDLPETLGSLTTACALLAVDLPMSAIGDTLYLPFDVAYTLRHQGRDVWAEWIEDEERRRGPTASRPGDIGQPFQPIRGDMNATGKSAGTPSN
jgi:uncharacterized protein YceK